MTYNTTVEGDIPVSYVESDQADLGRQTGLVARRYIEEKLGGKAKIATLAFKSQLAEQSDARRNGFVDGCGPGSLDLLGGKRRIKIIDLQFFGPKK